MAAEGLGVVAKLASGFVNTRVSIDNWSFKFYYKYTTSLLLLCSAGTTARQFFGDPIECDAGAANAGVEQDVLDSYCWMYSTWNIPREYKGVCSGGDQEEDRESIVYNSYYQWVPLYLLGLAILFYLPRMFWLMIEGGLMKFFGQGTTSRFVEDHDEKRERLVKYFCKNIHNKYNIYFNGFIFCEFLNFAIVLLQFVVTNQFLSRRFLLYGLEVWRYYLLPSEEQRLPFVKNPMCQTFPRIAACNYWRWGGSGSQENINAICILGLNIVNDKVFLVLWWWFLLLLLIGLVRLLYRAIQCRSAWLRYHLLTMRLYQNFKKSTKVEPIKAFVKAAKLGDWFVLYQMSKNLNRSFFMDFLGQVSIRFVDEVVESDEDNDAGDNLMSMLLKPSYTAQESKEATSVGDEESSNGGDEDQASPSRRGSQAEFRKHKTEIRKLKKELLEIRHTEVPRKGRGFEHESRIMDMNHELRRKQREERRASLRVPGRSSSPKCQLTPSWGEGLDLLSVYSNFN